jgi:hypothetical protein
MVFFWVTDCFKNSKGEAYRIEAFPKYFVVDQSNQINRSKDMFKIEKKDFGFKLTLGGFINVDEMKQWVEESKKALLITPKQFGVFVDMRELKPLPPESQSFMQEGQKLYKQKGMQRSVVIVQNAITKMQFKRIAKETGIYAWERYIDASEVTNWEKIGKDWICDEIDPDV